MRVLTAIPIRQSEANGRIRLLVGLVIGLPSRKCLSITWSRVKKWKSTSKSKEKVGTVGENDSGELKTLNCDAVYQMPQE